MITTSPALLDFREIRDRIDQGVRVLETSGPLRFAGAGVSSKEESSIGASYLRIRAYPFTPEIEDFIRRHDRVYVVEQNRDAQMLSLLRMEIDPILQMRLRSVLHYNGLPIDARSVTDGILAQEKAGQA